MPSEEWVGSTENLNGTEIYFAVRGSGKPIVLLHGFTGSSQDWKALPSEWCAEFQLIAPDLRGHGRSSLLSGQFRHDDAATDVIGLLDRLGIDSCKALGISGGGNLLLHLPPNGARL
jgi:pimeloyl-ACP methyl ester carboxylesterase